MKSGGRQDSLEGLIMIIYFYNEVITLSVACLLIKNFFTTDSSQNGGSAHGAQNGGQGASNTIMNQTMAIMPISAASAPGAIPGPTTNLNIGMDYWGAPASSTVPAIRGKVPSTPVAGGVVSTGSRDGVQSQIWLQVSFSLQIVGFRTLYFKVCTCLF
jgi:hypothetical protein